MHRVRPETERRRLEPRERRAEGALVGRRDLAVDPRERHVRAEGLVVERHVAVAERLADARAEAPELFRTGAGTEPDDVRAAALGETPEPVEDDVERRDLTGGLADGVGRRAKPVLRDVADEGKGQVEERGVDAPERGKGVLREECRRALGYVCGELDRDEEADRRRLDPRGDPCRLDLVGDEECEERDREDHGEHGQHGQPHRLVQLEVLPRRLDQLAHGLFMKQAACRAFDAQRSGNDACPAM